jgi:thiol:disulfide interchange protein DsbD
VALTELSHSPIVGAFAAGLVSSLTPCVYPLIPITLAVCGASKDASKAHAISRAVCYVLGMAATYTVLGLLAARSGAVFGAGLSNPWLVYPVAALVALMALASIEVIHLRSLHTIQTKASRIGGSGVGGVFLMGAASGLVAAPCVAPPLVAILGVAATSGSALRGGLLLFSYSLGMGMLFLLVALFPTMLNRLPRSGSWLTGVKLIIGAALFAVVLLLIRPVSGDTVAALLDMPKWLAFIVLPALGFAALAVAMRKTAAPYRIACALLLAPPIFLAVAQHGAASDLAWDKDVDHALASAKSANVLTLVDFSAAWCLACGELESKTFSNDEVRARLGALQLAKVDFTDPTTPVNQALGERFGVTGLPSVLFISPQGKELEDLRVTGFLTPQEFLQRLDLAKAQ